MKAYLIDPFKCEVRTVEYNNSLQTIYDLIQADTFDVARIHGMDTRDVILVDDFGLYKKPQAFFIYRPHTSVLAGYGLVLGTDYDGESIEPEDHTEESLTESIEWLSTEEAIEVAEQIDEALEAAEPLDFEGVTIFRTSTADIMKSQSYTDGPAGGHDDKTELPER